MKTSRELPDVEFLNSVLNYDPETGNLFWKIRPRQHFKTDGGHSRFNREHAGQIAGHKHFDKNGRPTAVVIVITIGGNMRCILAHRIAYSLMGVDIPGGLIVDHHNLDPFDNRWVNLRIATEGQNMANRPAGRRKRDDHAGLPKGVTRWGKRFKTQIALGGKKRHVGVYSTPEEAGAAYMEEARKAVGEFARG